MNTSDHDTTDREKTAPEKNPETTCSGRRLLRRAALGFAAFLVLITASLCAALLFLRSQTGEAWLTATLNEALASLPGGLSARMDSFQGPLPSRALVSGIVLEDRHGPWLEADDAELVMDWSALPKVVAVSELILKNPRLLRLPELIPTPEPQEKEKEPLSPEQALNAAGALLEDWPFWLPSFRVESLSVSLAVLPASLTGSDMTASLSASAALGAEGANLTLDVRREDFSCQPLHLLASFSPKTELALNAQGSDLGLAALLPDDMGSDATLLFSLEGKGDPERLSVNLTGRLLESSTENDMLTASAEAEILLKEADRQAFTTLTLQSGAAAGKLWALAGQKNGQVHATLTVQARQKDTVTLNASAVADLSDMDWSDSTLAALFGKEGTLRLSAGTEGKDLLHQTITLDELFLKAGRLEALVHGQAQFSETLHSPETNVSLNAACSLTDAGGISPDIAGNANFTADISGPMTALRTDLSLASDSFRLPGMTLEKARASLQVPLADIPRLMEELPRMAAPHAAEKAPQEPSAAPSALLAGQAKASLIINGQKTSLDTGWSVEDGETPSGRGLCLALEKLDLRLEDNSLQGSLKALQPFFPPMPEKGSMEELAGMALPALDGNVSVHIRHWNPVSRVSGLRMSGSPLTLDIRLSSLQKQQLEWQGRLDSFRLSDGDLSLSGLSSSLKAKDLWGFPELNLKTSLKTLKSASFSLNRVAVTMEGGQKSARASVQSRGDVRTDLALRWKPGEITVNTLSAEVSPSLLGLTGTSPAGIRLSRPTTLRYGKDSLSVPALSLTLVPGGSAELSGAVSKERAHVNAKISHVELAAWQTLLPSLPTGNVSFGAELSGQLSRPSGNFKLNFNNIQLPGATLPPVSGDVSGSLAAKGKRRMLDVSLAMTEESLRALGLDKALVDISLPFTSPAKGVSLPDNRGPLRGSIALSGELGKIWQLVPLDGQRLAGRADVEASLGGSPAAPELTLHAALDNGRFADIVQGVELRSIRLRADAEKLKLRGKSGGRLNMELSAADGRKGTLELSGWFEPSGMALSMNGKVDKLSPLRRQDIQIMLSGSAGVSGTVTSPSVRADITVDKGQIQLTSLPGGDIVTLPIEEPGQTAPPKEPTLQGKLNARIRIPNQFFIRGYGLDSEWKGDIRLRGPLARPSVTGSVEAVRGTLDILGKRFKLSEGDITFDGGWPVSPVLNIVMQYVASAITADITVGGPVTGPEIALSSEPEMPKDEILSQVMFNQSAGSLSHVQAIQLAAGAAELAGFGGGSVMAFGRKVFGLDVLKLSSDNDTPEEGENARTSLEMGTYVRDNVYVGVQQGLGRESETEAVVEIELTPGLEAQARASANNTEVGLEWKKNY